MTDSEEEGSEEGEVIETKKQKIDETKNQESDLEEGEILPSLPPPPPPPPPPETRGNLKSFSFVKYLIQVKIHHHHLHLL